MIKVTLDTNCVIYYLDSAHESPVAIDEISEIIRYGMEGNVHIAVTTRAGTDVEADSNEERKRSILTRLASFPVIGTVMRLDVSRFDSDDKLSGQETQAMTEELTKIIFPNLDPKDKHYKNKVIDIDHLIGHKLNQRDIFVTNDRDILRQAETLKLSQGIIVMAPAKCVEFLNQRANKTVLIEEFYSKFKELKVLVALFVEGRSDNEKLQIEYQELRTWLIRKVPSIKDGVVLFRQGQLSTPVGGGQSMIDQGQILSLQAFNDAFANLGVATGLQGQVEALGSSPNSYSYQSEIDIKRFAANRLNTIDTTLLGYLGSVESINS